jgi:hypothetical protein
MADDAAGKFVHWDADFVEVYSNDILVNWRAQFYGVLGSDLASHLHKCHGIV